MSDMRSTVGSSRAEKTHAHDDVTDFIWNVDNLDLLTVGIDIGSSTSHVMFSKLHLRRSENTYSSRFVVVARDLVHSSPVYLTPYIQDHRIDADRLRRFIDEAYHDSNVARDEVDTGAVILTGVALERVNAAQIAEMFAHEGGRFVCASAGHNLEALLAAHGSGAVARSDGRSAVLNVDIGGGTTKLALAEDGRVVATMAIAAGARLIAFDDDGLVERIEPAAAEIARQLEIPLRLGERLSTPSRARLVEVLADRIEAAMHGRSDPPWVLAGGIPNEPTPREVVVSGGVAGFLADESRDYGDLGRDLSSAVRQVLEAWDTPSVVAADPIRATVVGASQFSAQVSGNTVHVADPSLLPVHNLPVVGVDLTDADDVNGETICRLICLAAQRLDLNDVAHPLAVAIRWTGVPSYGNIRAIADGLAGAHRGSPRRDTTLTVVLEEDVAAGLGAILVDELGFTSVVAIDGLELSDFDFIDIGERVLPANVVPVVIKSLLFPHHSTDAELSPSGTRDVP